MMQRHPFVTWGTSVLVGAVAGLFFSAFIMPNGRPMIGMFFGVFTAVPMLAFMRGMFLPGLQRRLARLAFPLYVPASIFIYVGLVILSTVFAGSLLWITGILPGRYLMAIEVPVSDIVYSLLVLALAAFILRVKDLIGTEVFLSLLRGRYHKPVAEERVFLFVDVVGSTQFAQRFGDLRTQEFLGHFFAALAEPVRQHQGAIDDYVGDLAIVTWPMRRGIADARCVRCVFALLSKIAEEAPSWEAKFGLVPRFRAALHGGRVVAGEVGVDRRKIAYFGDTVNTTARLESLCREVDSPIVISAELLARIPTLPRDVHATNLGAHVLRGRDHPLAIVALTSETYGASRTARIAKVA
ncbi:MAG: adenylate/guanylate cyclase domain-containing protein [Hyphomicrobiales bacterium]|nr:adenylate/guanylate cyclase domain-containing protein [Hyphomicrobiales bacterium]